MTTTDVLTEAVQEKLLELDRASEILIAAFTAVAECVADGTLPRGVYETKVMQLAARLSG